MARQPAFTIAAALGLLLAGCSGRTLGTGTSLPNVGPDSIQTVSDAADALDVHRQSASQNATAAISATNAFASRVKELSEETARETVASLSVGDRSLASSTNRSPCRNGGAFFAPDRARDPNSTETLRFFDAQCRQLARDAVRLYAATGPGSERIQSRVALYVPGKSTPLAVRTEEALLSNATVGDYGFPIAADGFTQITSSRLSLANAKQSVVANSEIVMLPSQGRVNDFCAQSAGYSVSGVPSLDETFGWQGGALSGARATDERGFVTWSAAEGGNMFQGPIGSLSLIRGKANAACPIVTPAFALTGGNVKGAFSFPIAAAFRHGQLWSLTTPRAQLPNGDTLRASSTSNRHGQSVGIVGVISSKSLRIARFEIDGFGNGTLTITSTGAQYVIADWSVVGT